MARLKSEFEVEVPLGGEIVSFTLRNPSNEELNNFLEARWNTATGEDNAYKARCEFFDKILVNVKNLEDPAGHAITHERPDAIPSQWKAFSIVKLFEKDTVNIKN